MVPYMSQTSTASEVKTFRIKGRMRLRSGDIERFNIEIRALTGEQAVDRLYSILGSRHKLKRGHIYVEAVEVVENIEEVKNPYIQQLVAAEKIVYYD